MPTVTVLYGAAYDGKNRELFTRCLEKVRAREDDTCLYLVRTDVRVRQLRDYTLKQMPGWFHFPVHTFPDFIRLLYQRSRCSRRILSDLEQKILIERLLKSRKEQLGTQFSFRRFHEHPGIVGKLTDFINEIRRVGIASPQALERALKRISTQERGFLTELIELLARYCEELAQKALIDESGIFLEMAQRAIAEQLDLQPLIRSPELLVLEGYYDLTMPEQQILTALCAQFEQTFLTIDLPLNPYHVADESDLPRAFHLLQPYARYLKQSGFSVREYSAPRERRSDRVVIDRAARLAHCILLTPENVSAPPERISVLPCHSRKDEVFEIAREIRRLRQTGQSHEFREIGVAFPLIETYARLVREIFPLFGIPFTMFQGYSLASSPLVVTVFSMFNLILEDYSREAFARFFASPYIVVEPVHSDGDRGAELPALPLHAATYPYLDSFAVQAGILSGKETWIQQLKAYQTSFEDAGMPQPLLAVYPLLPAIFDFFEFLTQFEENVPSPPEKWFILLDQSLQRVQILSRLLQEEEQEIRERNSAALRAFLKLLQTLRQQYASSSLHWTFKTFVETLRIAIQGESYYPPETLEDSVFVMGRLDTRQVEFRYLFFGGLVEKDFPGQESPNIFLSDQEAEALGLATYKKAFAEAAYLFYLNVMNPDEHVYLSYPLQEDDKDVLRSMYVEQIEYALVAQKPEFVEEKPEQQVQHLYTANDIVQWLGVQLFQHHQPESGSSKPSEAGVLHALKFLRQIKGEEYVQHFLSGLHAHARRKNEHLTQFDGLLQSDWAKQFLCFRHTHYVYAVSEFDLYARCPIKYFFQRLLRLSPLFEIAHELLAQDVGMLLHRILARFYADTLHEPMGKADAAFLHRKTDAAAWLQEARQRILAIAEAELAAYNFSGTFWESFTHALLAGLASGSHQQGLLAKFVRLEAQDTDKVNPWYLEAHFGMPPVAKWASIPIGVSECCGYKLSDAPFSLQTQDRDGKMHTIRLRGKIDRIDLESPTPADPTERINVVIYDYKTGTIPSGQKLKEGRFLQLPLYILAAQDLLGETYRVIAGGYYQLQSPQNIGKKHLLGSKKYADRHYFKEMKTVFPTDEEYVNWLTLSARRVMAMDQDIRQGYFHPTLLGEAEAGCRYCEYQQICRVDHQWMSKFQEREPGIVHENLDTIP